MNNVTPKNMLVSCVKTKNASSNCKLDYIPVAINTFILVVSL